MATGHTTCASAPWRAISRGRSRGSAHVTDASNAGVTGLILDDASDWDDHVLEELRLARAMLPRIVDSTGVVATASALPGEPPIAGLVGDQQSSLIGQACLKPGEAKATFGTGGMLDCVTPARPAFSSRGDRGTFPIIAWREAGQVTWGIEAIMLSAGSCIEWLRAGLGLIGDAAESDEVAGSVPDAGGVIFVPALGGLGTPAWDFGARAPSSASPPRRLGPNSSGLSSKASPTAAPTCSKRRRPTARSTSQCCASTVG